MMDKYIKYFHGINKNVTLISDKMIFVTGNYFGNKKWSEIITPTHGISVQLTLDQLKTKSDMERLNGWVSYINQNYPNYAISKNITINLNNPNVSIINQNIQKQLEFNETFNLRKVFLNDSNEIINFKLLSNRWKVTVDEIIVTPNNYNEETLSKMVYEVDARNLSEAEYKILKELCNNVIRPVCYNKLIFSNFTNPIIDKTINCGYYRIYQEKVKSTKYISDKIFDFQNILEKNYKTHIYNYQKFYKKEFYVTQFNPNQLNQLINEVNTIHQIVPLDFTVYIPFPLNDFEESQFIKSII